jgi:hypothetical protein
VLTIRGAKFGKSRLVPLHASTRKVLADYVARRERAWAKRPVSSYLFVSGWGNRLDGGNIRRTFYALSRQIGLRGPSDNRGPRLHAMRHGFASTTLLRRYRTGENAERRLPILSAYLRDRPRTGSWRLENALLVDPDNSTRRLLIADGYPAQPEIWAWCCPSSRRPRPSKSTLPSLRPPPSTPMRSRFFWRSSDRYYPRLPNCRPAANIVCPRLSSAVEFDKWLFCLNRRSTRRP